MSTIDKKILDELKRYNDINKYIKEQDELALPPTDTLGGLGAPTAEPTATPTTGATETLPEPTPVDIENDPDVEKIDDKGDSEEKTETEGGEGTEELDVTELVNTQKSISEKQDSYFEELFNHLKNLESKLSEMDNLVGKINSLEAAFEKYRPKTAQEKLELRSLDSGPFNQKLTDFFQDKEKDLEKSGKNEYVLTTDDVKDYSPSEVQDTFDVDNEENFKF